ncbi:MAG TPA: glycosyltransferase [Candidatus Paceibacterota bacterium]|nr:glycosyltransferase [Candidatus Paceibacterota bacterium]
MKNPLITVTINNYNYGRFIEDSIQSVLNQTYTNFELIVVDDCSADDSYDRARKYEKKDSRVSIVRLDKNGGIGKAKNEGIVRSKGDYIVTLDADDMMTKKSLEVRIKAAIKYNVSFVHADAFLFKGFLPLKDAYKLKNIKTIPKKWPRRLHCPTVYTIHAQTVLMKRWIYQKYGLYDEDLGCKVDREMWLRLFGKEEIDEPKITSKFIDKCVSYYRWHSKQVTKKRQKDPSFYKLNKKLCEKKYIMRKKSIDKTNTRFLEK